MAHLVEFSHDYNGYVRQLRSFLMNAPRVVRSDHENINVLGVSYELSGGGARPAGDILHLAPSPGADEPPLTPHRMICRVAGNAGQYGTQEVAIQVDFNTGGRTIINDDSVDFSTNFTVGDLVRVDDAVTAGNNGVFRILTITTTSTTNDTITLRTEDSLSASDLNDDVTLTPIGNGAVFELIEDQGSGNNHEGWFVSEVEGIAKDGSVWAFMRNGGAWAVGDFADWTFERGPFTLFEDKEITRTVTFVDGGGGSDTITRTDYNGSFIRDGFINGGIIDISGTASNNGEQTITAAVTARTIILATATLTAEGPVECEIIPRLTESVTFATPANTLVRGSGSWITDGYEVGGHIEIANAVDPGNNGYFLVDTVVALTLTLDSGETIAAEAGDTITHTPRNTSLQAWTEHRYTGVATSQASHSTGRDLTSGAQPQIVDSNGNYTSEWVAIAPGNDPINNPQTIFIGWQTLFTTTTKQNVEVRGFDAVSDSDFSALSNASPPTYLYLDLSPSMESFFAADGEYVRSLVDVSSITEWMYGGFVDVHASSVAHPRPIFIGGMGFESNADRTTQTDRQTFFVQPMSRSGSSAPQVDPPDSSAWFRWTDGTWYGVYNDQVDSGNNPETLTSVLSNLMVWPYNLSGATVNPEIDGGTAIVLSGSTTIDQPGAYERFTKDMVATPTTVTPNPDRQFPLLPCVLFMQNPGQNIVADLRGVYFTPHDGQTTLNRILLGNQVYITGRNHEKTSADDFAAFLLN